MSQCGMMILKGSEVLSLLTGRESELMDLVRAAYIAHARNKGSGANFREQAY